MFLHPHLVDARPLLVVGLPRCGTRFVANALNAHPDVYINSELLKAPVDDALAFLTRADEAFQTFEAGTNDHRIGDGWKTNRRHLLYAFWGALGKRRAMTPPKRPVSWYGYKSPNHDRYWRFYRDFLGDMAPQYVFCVRDFVGHHLGLDALGGRPIEESAERYRIGINRYAEMKAALGDDVSLFVLNDLREGGIDHVRRTLFDPFGIPLDDEIAARIDPAKPANSSAEKGVPKRELTTQEQRFLERNQDLLRGLDAAREAQPLSDPRPAWRRVGRPVRSAG